MPEPACALGYTEDQLAQILGTDLDAYRAWSVGKTQGLRLEGQLRHCTEPHGRVHYEGDVRRFNGQALR